MLTTYAVMVLSGEGEMYPDSLLQTALVSGGGGETSCLNLQYLTHLINVIELMVLLIQEKVSGKQEQTVGDGWGWDCCFYLTLKLTRQVFDSSRPVIWGNFSTYSVCFNHP